MCSPHMAKALLTKDYGLSERNVSIIFIYEYSLGTLHRRFLEYLFRNVMVPVIPSSELIRHLLYNCDKFCKNQQNNNTC
jgi:hypothetical protein